MAIADEIKALEAELSAASISVDTLLDKAGVDRSSWTRWKAGTFSPRMDSWAKVQDAVRELIPWRREAASESQPGAAA